MDLLTSNDGHRMHHPLNAGTQDFTQSSTAQ